MAKTDLLYISETSAILNNMQNTSHHAALGKYYANFVAA